MVSQRPYRVMSSGTTDNKISVLNKQEKNMNTVFPLDVVRLIYAYDPTYHHHHRNVLHDLEHNFWKWYESDDLGKLLKRYREERLNRFVQGVIMSLSDKLACIPQDTFDPFQEYMQIDAEEHVKQEWFMIIKMNSRTGFTFFHHVLILQDIIKRLPFHKRWVKAATRSL